MHGATMAEKVGLVVCDVSTLDADQIVKLLDKTTAVVPEGRMLAVMWNTTQEFNVRIPVEAIVTSHICGPPDGRCDRSWLFFANGVSRCYSNNDVVPKTFWNWLIFRRPGPRTLELRSSQSKKVVERSKLQTLDNVFTRDVANNVWHLPARSGRLRTIRRLQALTTWATEVTVIVSHRGARRRLMHEKLSLKDDYVGRAEKSPYAGVPTPLGL